ncbi:3-hydroxyacyl-CoA dehydrogenase NAD-binding domain-containing protein [Pseudaeromonas paramecii]|uniref:enoyl-CoA hydratase n=1 Tax=Pseudaeromonas paramecii TaxID=2138166 RepID=A0ABP8Q1C7_9GAMM
MNQALTLSEGPDGLLILTIDNPRASMNVLDMALLPEFAAVLDLLADQSPAGLLICSGKPDSFIAGADIKMLDACADAAAGSELASQGQQLFARLAALPFPTMALIHGPCLGGGLELALACDRRICSDDDKTRLGLPEVKLGLLPGSGGTQRLPARIGLPAALDLMLSGRTLKPRQAKRLGLVEAVVPVASLHRVAADLLRQPAPKPRWLARQSLRWPWRPLLLKLASRQAQRQSQGHYPAIPAILQAVTLGLTQGAEVGQQEEARQFGQLLMSGPSRALRGLFHASQQAKQVQYQQASPLPVSAIGVLGGGLMGGGIGLVSVQQAGLDVRFKELSHEGLAQAMAYGKQRILAQARQGRLSPPQVRRLLARYSGSLDYRGFANRQLVVEAVFEDLTLKQQMVAEIEALGTPLIFASNTSSLPIAQLAAQAAHPERIIGLHYFSPVEKMPLVEVIPHAGTDPQVVATVLALALAQGKTPVVVKDSVGFYVNRILTPYLNEALRLLAEGQAVAHIDQCLRQFGFPVGPLALLDEVGFAVGAKVAQVLTEAFGDRMQPPDLVPRLQAAGRQGRKSGAGFYRYDGRGGKRRVDDRLPARLDLPKAAPMDGQTLVRRCLFPLYNEAALCLAEGVIGSAQEGDLAAVMGIGFPPFLGGPFAAMGQLGGETLLTQMAALAAQAGERFSPNVALRAWLEGQPEE